GGYLEPVHARRPSRRCAHGTARTDELQWLGARAAEQLRSRRERSSEPREPASGATRTERSRHLAARQAVRPALLACGLTVLFRPLDGAQRRKQFHPCEGDRNRRDAAQCRGGHRAEQCCGHAAFELAELIDALTNR